jgi:hypothetical protein
MQKHERCVQAIFLAFFLLAFPSALAAAEHHGRVMFGGVPVPGATVSATQGQKHLTTVTDLQGIFQFPDIADGTWTIRVEMQGFSAAEQSQFISATTPASTWEMKMLPLKDILSAPPTALPAPSLQPRRAADSSDPSTKKFAQDLAAAEPTPARPADADAGKAAEGMLINGSENNAATSKYTISPAFGTRRPGSKGLYTGSIGGMLNNSSFDSRPYSLTGLQVPKASYNRFTGIATIGGPLNIPHVLRNGPNFFLGYQWTRDREASTLSGLVPTLAQRGGDLSGTVTSQGQPVTIVDPATGLPLTGPVPISPQASALLQLYPLPNLVGSNRYNYQTQVLTNTHADSLQSRLDKGFGRRDQVYGGFAFRSVRSDNENLFHFRDTTQTLGIDSNVNWSHRYPHQILLVLTFQFSRLRTQIRPNFEDRQNVSGNAGITGNEQSPTNWGPPDLSFSNGIAGLSDAQSAFNRNRTDGVSAAATWTHRKHVVTFGGDFRRQEFNQFSQQNARGAFTFTGAATRSTTRGTTGSDYADFLMGVPDASSIAFGNADKYLRQSVYDAFITDDWRVIPELTINAGIRWDYGAPLTELKGRLVNLDIAQGFIAATPVLGSAPTGSLTGMRYPSSLIRRDLRKFQPRIGISWRPFPTSTMVVRAGYGIYVDTSVYLASAQQMAQQSPLSKSLTVSNNASCTLSLANGFRDCAGTTANTFAVDPNFRTGYAQTWRLSVQRDLPASLVLTATYLGTKGTRGPQEFLPNTDPIGATPVCAACPRGFIYRTSDGASIRHAGEVQLRRRLRSGLTATLDYVYSKSLDNVSALGGLGHLSTSFSTTAESTIPAESIAQNWRDLRAERSRSSFDQRHLLKLQFQYTTGVGLRGGTLLNGWGGTVLKQWTISSSLTSGTDLPQTPIYFAAVPGTGVTGTIRPNRTSASVYGGAPGYFLNASAYTAAASGQWGNAGRYSIKGPNTVSLDSSLARTFRLRDPFNFDLRLDATNVVNHVTYTGWNTVINANTFGLPAGTKPMRSLQISGRLRF